PNECARYLETLKSYENKPANGIQERVDSDYISRLTSALTSIRHVNKTDALTLGTNFGTLANIMGASMDDLSRCPGIGEKKVSACAGVVVCGTEVYVSTPCSHLIRLWPILWGLQWTSSLGAQG
ncbi:unnamed protein product, partial [Closterium sp. Naga37s-1]